MKHLQKNILFLEIAFSLLVEPLERFTFRIQLEIQVFEKFEVHRDSHMTDSHL